MYPRGKPIMIIFDCDRTLTQSDGSWAELHSEFETRRFQNQYLEIYR